MKKIRFFSIILFLVSTAAFVSFKMYDKISHDGTAPVITFESDELIVSIEDDIEAALLEGVKADDNRSGDISDSVLVEQMSDFTQDDIRIVTYAVADESGNVTKKERNLKYSDYQEPWFTMTDDLRFPSGEKADISASISAESVLDGDLSTSLSYTLEKTIDVTAPGTYPIEFKVKDDAGKTVYLNTEVEIYDALSERIEVQLSTYLVYLGLNSAFQAESYYAGASEEGTLQISSNVNTAAAGVYYVDYTVVGANSAGKSRLIVVVEE